MTGSGKTYFAKRALRPESVSRLVVIDTKKNLADDMQLVPATRRNWRKFIRGENMRLQVTHPNGMAAKDIPYYFDDQFRLALEAANCIIYIDEAHHVAPNSVTVLPYLTEIYTRGREAIFEDGKLVAGHIGVMAAAQRPSRIPLFLMTESSNFFIFRLQDPDDRKRMSAYMGEQVNEPIQDTHGFWYFLNQDMKQPEYIPQLIDPDE